MRFREKVVDGMRKSGILCPYDYNFFRSVLFVTEILLQAFLSGFGRLKVSGVDKFGAVL